MADKKSLGLWQFFFGFLQGFRQMPSFPKQFNAAMTEKT